VGGFNFYGAAGGAVGRTLGFSTPLATLGLSGTFNTLGAITQSGNQVLHAGNYNSYSPTLTGGGASGTWGINVTGTAAGETFSTVSTRGNSYINPSFGGISIGETFANYDGWNTQLNVHGGPHSRITVKTDTVRMGIYAHNTWQSVNGVTPGGFVGTYNNYPLSILVNSAQRMVFNTSGNIGIATDDFSYTTSDSTPVIGSITNNRLFINGSIQLIGSNDAIVFGRNTSTFLKDEELGFGWGGGWYMNDATWIRARNDKNIITGGSLTVGGNIRQGNNIARPLSQWSASGTATGMVFFELPGTTSNYGMVHMVFDIYEYDSNSVSTVIVGGHNWAGGWYNLASNVIGQTNKQVRLGTRGGKYVVCFGTAGSTWSYGTVILRKIHNGGYYDNIIDMNAQFVANITTSESLTWDSGDLRALRTPSSFNAIGAITQNGNQVLHASNYNSYALPLSGGTITSNLNIDGTLGFRRGSGDYSTYIKANGYPAQGYANADGSKYWVEIGAAGGVHVILNTDGAANSAENSYDHFTVWQNSNTGTRLFHVTNGGNAVISGSLTVGGKIQRSAAGAGYLDGGYSGVETTSTSGAIYSIGGSYVPGTTNLGNMYGIGYSYSGYAMGNPGGVATNRWGMYVASAGVARIFLDSDDGSGYFAGGVVANSIRLNQERALNARIYSASAGSMGLLGVDSNNAYRWQIYGTGTEYGFLNGVWAGWDLRKNVNGELLVTVSGAERTVLHAGNYNSYSPTLTGGGASGTWGISISGSAAQLNGYASSENGGGSVILRTASNGYLYVNNWINTNAGGIFSSVNSAHFYPNNSNEYGSWRISGTLNGWHGIYFDSGSNLMMNSSEVGFHRAGHGWQMRWSGGTGYINKGNPGGGTQATILDSSNYNSYSPTLTGGGASGTWGINVTGSAGSVAWTNVSGKPTSFGLSKAQVYFFCSF
jgi:hypothetical protein